MQFPFDHVRVRLLLLGFTSLILAGASGCSGISSSSNKTNTNGTVPIQFSESALPSAAVGSAYTATLKVTGGTAPYSFAVVSGTLPSGLSLSGTTGVVSGTPTASGQFSFTVQASDSSTPPQTAQAAFSISVNPQNGVVISTSALPTGTVGTAYSTIVAATGGTPPYSWTTVSGTLPAGLSLSKNGTISGTPTGAGQSNFTLQVTDSSSPVQNATKPFSITMSVSVPPLTITSSSLPSGTVGTAYSTTLVGSGGTLPYSWTLASGSLPAGLSLNKNGTISGTPTSGGQSNFTVQVTDFSSPAQQASQALAITVASKLAITGSVTPNAAVGVAYTSTDQASGGTPSYTWSVSAGALPPGLDLAASTGTISGTPSQNGAYNFTLKAVDSGSPAQSATQTDTITVITTTNAAWSLQKTPVGWQFVSPSGAATCKYNAVSKVDITDLQDAGTSDVVQSKYGDSGSSWSNWAAAQNTRLMSLGFTAAGQYSYQFSASHPTGGLPFAPTYGLSGYTMQDIAHDGLGPFHAKDLGYIPWPSGMKCGSSFYQGSEVDPFDPNTAAGFNDLLANDFVHGWNFANAIIAVPDEADFLFGVDQANNPSNAHPDLGLMIAANSPMVLTSRPGGQYYASGSYSYPNSELYAKQALRDYLLNEHLCTGAGTPVLTCTGAGTGTGSADPSAGSYVGAGDASIALNGLNAAWGTSYTTWNTSDANGLAGISNDGGSPIGGEAFATGNGSTNSFAHTAGSLPVHASAYQIYVNGTEVAEDNGSTILVPVAGSTFANGNAAGWKSDTAYSLNTQAREGQPGCMLIVTMAGTSGSSAPSWPACPGTSPLPTVSDGSVVWTVLGPRPTIQYSSGVGVITFTTPPASGAGITISYSAGQAAYESWGGNAACSASKTPYACCTGQGAGSCTQGTGFLDEAGFNLVKAGQSCSGKTGNGIQETDSWSDPAQIQTDVDAFVASLAATYAQELKSAWVPACGSTCPPMALPVYDGPWNGTASVYAAMAPSVDLFWIAPSWYLTAGAYTAEVQNIINNDGGKPVIVANYFRANPDSWVQAACDAGSGLDCQVTQALRGSFMVGFDQASLALKNPNGKYAVVGLEHWSLYDSHGEGRDFGLFTPNDNGYDGSAASTATSSGSCAPNHAYTAPAICQDPNGNYQGLAVTSCTSGGSSPTWNTNFNGVTTNDGSCTWFNEGPYAPVPESADWGDTLLPMADFFNAGICDP